MMYRSKPDQARVDAFLRAVRRGDWDKVHEIAHINDQGEQISIGAFGDEQIYNNRQPRKAKSDH